MVDLKGKTLYEALGVDKEASQADIRKAYHKLALQLHPDKNPDDASAKDKFQTLQKVHAILSDADKRKVYDQTGSVDDAEELAGDKFNDLYNYYRSIYVKVTESDLDSFQSGYRGSEEERGDVLKYYQQFKGHMAKVFEWVMCSEELADSHRFMDLVDAAVKAKQVPAFPKYAAWAKRVAARPRPKTGTAAAAAAKRAKKGAAAGDGGEAALIAQIRGRQQQQQGMQAFRGGPGGGVLGKLMAQFGGGPSDLENIPSEEDFQAARQRLEQRASGSGSGSSAATAAGGGSKKGGKQKAAAASGGGKRAKK